MATHLVITHTLVLKDGGPREQADILGQLKEPLDVLEAAVKTIGGTTTIEAPRRKGPVPEKKALIVEAPILPRVKQPVNKDELPWEIEHASDHLTPAAARAKAEAA